MKLLYKKFFGRQEVSMEDTITLPDGRKAVINYFAYSINPANRNLITVMVKDVYEFFTTEELRMEWEVMESSLQKMKG